MQENDMTFEQFQSSVLEDCLHYLPDEFADADVSVKKVVKNNDTALMGLLIHTDKSNITPTIYLEAYYDDFVNGKAYESILRDIADVYLSHAKDQDFDFSNIMDYEKIKDRISCRLVNAAHNSEFLSDKPHKFMEDLAVVYHVDLGESEGGRMSSPITNNMISQYRITVEELHDVAMDNLSRSEIKFVSMRDMLVEMMGPQAEFMVPEEETPAMYVLTNSDNIHGAASILDQKTMDMISDKLGGSFVILPSSIHEVLVVPLSDQFEFSELEHIVQDVNAGQVAEAERLSDHVYMYDPVQKEVLLADRMQERLKEREAQEQQVNEQQTQGPAMRRHRGR